MSAATTLQTDENGVVCAAVPVEELEDWAWLLRRLEEWLGDATAETRRDWEAFSGPCGSSLEDVVAVLGRWALRMGWLAMGRP
jgi:hypothetical protein